MGPVGSSHRTLLDRLIATRDIPIQAGAIFDTAPGPLPPDVEWDRVEGMLLGLAIGDALGNPTEGKLPAERRAQHREITGFRRDPATMSPRGLPSDDTQLAFWTLEQMLDDGGFDPERVARRFSQQRIFGIGKSMTEFLRAYKAGHEPWHRAGARSAGNGALMRIAPMLLPHLRSGTRELWADVALSAAITHRDAASISACVAFAAILWQALSLREIPQARWWLDTHVDVARSLEGPTLYRPRGGQFRDYEGPLWRYAEERVSEAVSRGQTVLEACNSWYSGAYLLETVPSALYILTQHGHDPAEAITRAVNDTKDNDTVAAIVGAAVGALHGKQALPPAWVAGLAGRTAEHDDGKVFELIRAARREWWEGR